MLEQKNLTLDEYIGQVKTTVFGMTGALSSKIDQIMNDLFQLINSQQTQIKTNNEEIDRLQQLLIANKIDFAKSSPKPATKKSKTK